MRETLKVVPLLNDPTIRYLGWSVTFMVWLSTLFLGLSMIISNLGDKSADRLLGKVTIQINPTELDNFAAFDSKITHAIETLMKLPGIESVETLPHSQINKILGRLIGSDVLPHSPAFPLPTVIEIQLADKSRFGLDKFKSSVTSAIPNAKVIQQLSWFDIQNQIRNAINVWAWGIMGLIFLGFIVTIIFATRTGLIVHSDIIELLYLLGARNKDIARQFSIHCFHASLKGTLLGWLLAVITFFVSAKLIDWETPYGLGFLSVSWLQWTSLAMIGFLAVVSSTIVSNITVRERLRRLA